MSRIMTALASRNVRAVAAVSGAVLLHLAAHFTIMLHRPGWSLATFRGYYEPDQLSYLAIVANASEGQFQSMEPFTETGAIYYPRGYYLFVGVIARVFGMTPPTAWALTGLAMQILMVASLAIACIILSRKPWTGLLAAFPFVLGTLSWVNDPTIWATKLDSHAVLWGPFAVLFPLNAESAGLCLGAVAILLLLLTYLRTGDRPRVRAAIAITASGIVGLLANVQTYSFITTAYLVAFIVAAVSMAKFGGKFYWPVIVSLGLVGVVFLLGPVVADLVGPLAALVFGMLPTAPGLVIAVIRTRGLAAICAVVAVLAASPSVVATVLGLRSGDDFLVYRVASSANLGVPFGTGLIAALPVAIALLVILAGGILRRNPLWIAFPIASGTAWALMSSNDVWGANQEPYRFWINSFLLIAVAALPIGICVVADLFSTREPAGSLTPLVRRIGLGALAATLVVAGVSAIDWAVFYVATAKGIRVISFQGERETAITTLAEQAEGQLILTDPCISPVTLKIASGAPVVFMNVGMAWPSEFDAVNALLQERTAGRLNAAYAVTTEVRRVLTDSSCEFEWGVDYSDHLSDPVTVSFVADGVPGELTLWKFD